MKSISALCAVCVMCANVASGQVFTVIDSPPRNTGVPGPRPTARALAVIDPAACAALFAGAPAEIAGRPLKDYGLRVSLPLPSGKMEECAVAESSVMEPALQAKFPSIRTYVVQSVDNPQDGGRIEISPRGLTAMIRGARGTWMMDPWQSADAAHIVSYYLNDLPGGTDWVCGTTEGVHGFSTHEQDVYQQNVLTSLRTYRVAMACTGEYGAYQCEIQGHPQNIADPLAAIVTVMGRTNVVYEADLTVRLVLVANNDLLIFTDPATDPYVTDCSGTGGADCSGVYLNANAGVINPRIGTANYDLGHCITRVFGGVAYLSSVCGTNKAGGVSGIPRGGDVDPFSALVVIHEMGHQFGANHTFSGTRGRCAGNVNLSTAWEAGSGSTPMAYAGGCPVGDLPPTDNVAQFADPFFHHGSLREMQTFLASNANNCPIVTGTTNNAPSITSTSPSIEIPPGTPFVLAAAATDADGNTLTYSWEQFDSGVARPLTGTGAVDNGSGALFRAFPPVLGTSRTFPRMADVLSGVPTPGEMLPTVTGVTRRFRVLVRDNVAGAGGVAISSFVNLQIPAGTSPFAVTSPVAGEVRHWGANSVTWSVGGTNAAPISCSTVSISLTLDDGATYSTLLSAAPNTGTASVMLPQVVSGNARIRIDANGEIFFAMSRPFSLLRPCDQVDFNHDGVLDFFDYLDFVDAFASGVTSADFNHDGSIDFFDYLDFVDSFSLGC